MAVDALVGQVLSLPPDERRQLLERIWDSLDGTPASVSELSDSQKAELDRRIADMDANPEDEMSIEEFRRSLGAEP